MGHSARTHLISTTMLTLTLFLVACSQDGDTIIASAPAQHQLRVRGQAVVTARPDIARVQLGVQTYEAELDEAMAANNTRTAAVQQALRAGGIADSDMWTSDFSVSPQRDYSKESDAHQIIGYWVNNTVRVTIRDLEAVGTVLADALGAGANNINGLSFTLEDFGPVREQARIAAVRDAAARATTLAEAAGATLGRVLTIEEISSGGIVYQRTDVAEDAVVNGAVPVVPGELNVSVQVAVVYALD